MSVRNHNHQYYRLKFAPITILRTTSMASRPGENWFNKSFICPNQKNLEKFEVLSGNESQ